VILKKRPAPRPRGHGNTVRTIDRRTGMGQRRSQRRWSRAAAGAPSGSPLPEISSCSTTPVCRQAVVGATIGR